MGSQRPSPPRTWPRTLPARTSRRPERRSARCRWPRCPRPPPASIRTAGQPAALYVEMQPPPPSVARSLRLTPGQIAAMVTVRFDDPDSQEPVALTRAAEGGAGGGGGWRGGGGRGGGGRGPPPPNAPPPPPPPARPPGPPG